jgi:hypothetical protein
MFACRIPGEQPDSEFAGPGSRRGLAADDPVWMLADVAAKRAPSSPCTASRTTASGRPGDGGFGLAGAGNCRVVNELAAIDRAKPH